MFDTDKQKYVCDAEIGGPKKGWRGCRKIALYACDTIYGGGELHFCNRHINKARKPLKSITQVGQK